jgi:PAS domain S-box-containing protein
MNTALTKSENLYQRIVETACDGIIISDLETGRILFANSAAAEMHGFKLVDFQGMKLQDFIYEKGQLFFEDFTQAIRENAAFEKIAQHVRENHATFCVEWHAVPIFYQERNCALAFLRDTDKRIRMENKLKQRMMEHAQEQAILLKISHALASTLVLQPDLILDQLYVLIEYTHASLFTLEDSTLITLAVQGIQDLGKPLPFRIKLNGKRTLETLFNEHQPIRIADLSSNDPNALFVHSLLKNDSAILLEGVQSWMWVPLAVRKRIVGGIGIAHADRNFFTSHHAELAMTIANQAAITLANAELYENAQTYAALHERQRIAQNLHDAVNQSLFSAGLIAEVLPRLWEREPEEAHRSLEDLRRLIRGAMAEMRALLAELRPSTLVDAELGDLLLLLGNAFSGRTNIPVDVTIIGEHSLPSEIQVTLYRICQEALNNIAKHANASLVEIDLHQTQKGLELRIHDNGCGFDTSKPTPPDHFGLTMMQERTETIQAKLEISSKPGEGTLITIQWNEKEEK